MLYKFKSKTSGDVIMLQANGQHMLEIMDKFRPDKPAQAGILLPEQMAGALAALTQAIQIEEAARAKALADAQVKHLPLPKFEMVALKQRALPLMNMIKQCLQDEVPITWGL